MTITTNFRLRAFEALGGTGRPQARHRWAENQQESESCRSDDRLHLAVLHVINLRLIAVLEVIRFTVYIRTLCTFTH